MEKHHTDSIRNLVGELEKDPAIQALVLGGSIAHGFARPDSDIDVTIVVATADYQRRQRESRLHYYNRALCTYDGYIDGKYVDLEFLRRVAERGSEPARYAYEGARILFSREPAVASLLAAIVRYPTEGRQERIERFAAQLLAWRWYFSEGVRQDSAYLRTLAVQKLVLFGCRIVLAENELLYPYHKWMLRVTASARRQPEAFATAIDGLLAGATWEAVDGYVRRALAFAGIDFARADAAWPTTFMKDSEQTWLRHEPAVDDL